MEKVFIVTKLVTRCLIENKKQKGVRQNLWVPMVSVVAGLVVLV